MNARTEPSFALPLIGHFPPFEWITEALAWTGLIAILALMAIRHKNHPRSAPGDGGRRSRFFGSTWWQAYYVEFTILGVMICILLLRPLEYALEQVSGGDGATALHYPLTGWLGESFSGASVGTLETAIIVVAAIKILISFAWMITIALTPTMGVAWHRFLAFFNIFFKRHADGRTSLGELQPIKVGGEVLDFEQVEELDEDAALGVGKIEDFTWKGLLDFTTQFDVDPTHITLLNKDFLRVLFVLEGFARRRDLEERMDWAGKDRVLVYERIPGP